MSPAIKYTLTILLVLILIFFSFDFERMDRHESAEATFNAEAFASALWENSIPEVYRELPELDELLDLLPAEAAFSTYSKKLGISHTVYFFVKGAGKIISRDEENLLVETNGGKRVRIAIDFIFGNAVRDGSGLVDIDDFLNMTDFNNVSVALNRLVKDRVAKDLARNAEAGMLISFSGVFEISEEEPELAAIRIIPVSAAMSSP